MRTNNTTTNALETARRMINTENAFGVVTSMTRQLRDLNLEIALDRSNGLEPASSDLRRLGLIRKARAVAFDVYQELFGLDELDDTLELCDLILTGETV
jgi:hypothetical protein